MVFNPAFRDGEELEEDIELIISKKPQIRLVLTNKAAYWPGKKTFAVSDPITTIKVDLSEIESIFIGKKSSLSSLLSGIVMIILGGAWTFAGYPNSYYVGYPQALIVGGIILAFFGGKRTLLKIYSRNEKLQWSAPLGFGKKFKEDINTTVEKLSTWAKKHSILLKQT